MASVSGVPVREDTMQSLLVPLWVCQIGQNAVTFHSQTHTQGLGVANLCCHNIPSVSQIQSSQLVPISTLMQVIHSLQFPNPKNGTDYPSIHNNNRKWFVLIKLCGKLDNPWWSDVCSRDWKFQCWNVSCFIALLTFHRPSGVNPTLDSGTVNEKCI